MKKTNLAEALHKTVEQNPPRPARKAGATATTREGKMIAGWFPLEVSKQLKLMGANSDKTIQDLLAEALNDLFTKHGKSPIA